MIFHLFLFLSLLTGASTLCASLSTPISAYGEPQEIVIYNRILARVGNKTISVLDLVKKMDLFLNSNYPQVLESKLSRFQFYTSNWRDVLNQMVDTELMLHDAGEKDFSISDGEIRETLMARFGPNVMATLDKCGLTYEEARQTVRDDLVVQRMNWFKVQVKALHEVGPQDIREAYQEYLKQHPREEEWTYQVVSIRSPQKDLSEKLAQEAFSLLHEAKIDMATLQEKLHTKEKEQEGLSFFVSDLLVATERTISKAHRKGLEGLKEGECSSPITQISGAEQTPVQRIFHLKSHAIKQAPPFKELKDQLRQQRLDLVMQREDSAYKDRLRHRFSYLFVFEELPNQFEPFSLEFNHS